eukprot:TRINITY_DN8492_c0_g4_i1.p1 TRINITY_DN8492_c0_g4~~TRINITY_DN8492_c0_g4_i1.p1  ORF type:complete len:535 (+),score=152.39 TRINITY_DN8492_c0_g4_i1:85-1689(+)
MAGRALVAAAAFASVVTAAPMFGCQQTSCRTTCANCPPTANNVDTCASGFADCGDPTAGTATDQAWATGCYQYRKLDGIDDASCDDWKDWPWKQAGILLALVMMPLSCCVCYVFGCARVLCNCCGGSTINTDSLCCGKDGTACSGAFKQHDGEKEEAAVYFTSPGGLINPWHPTGARVLTPLIIVVFCVLSIILTNVGATKVNKAVRDVFDDGKEAIDRVLTDPNTQFDANLTASLDCRIFNERTTTYRNEGITFSNELSIISDAVSAARRELDDVEADTDNAEGHVRRTAIVLGILPFPTALGVILLAALRCGRTGRWGCNGICAYLFLFLYVFPTMVYTWLLVGATATVSAITDDFCSELGDLTQSPPITTGILAGYSMYDACKFDTFEQELNDIVQQRNQKIAQLKTAALPTVLTEAPCPTYDNAIDILRGNPRRLPRGGIWEGMISCRRIYREIAVSFDGSCGNFNDGVGLWLTGLICGCIALIVAWLAIWIGYKRFISEDDTTQPVQRSEEEMRAEPFGEENSKPVVTE